MWFWLWAGGICTAGILLVGVTALVVQKILAREKADPAFERKMDAFRTKAEPILKFTKSFGAWVIIAVFLLYWFGIWE